MRVTRPIATGQAALAIVVAWLGMTACLNKKARSAGELRSVTVRSKGDDSLDLPLLKSFGFVSSVRQLELSLPLPAGGAPQSVSLGALGISVEGNLPAEAPKLLPLFAAAVSSRVSFADNARTAELSDFFAPALQSVLNQEFRFDNKSAKLSSSDALLAVLQSDGRTVRFVGNVEGNTSSLLLDGVSFRNVGDLPAASKAPQGSRRERNSGFAVGDLLAVSEDGVLRHAALWLDHDIFFEALPFGNSVLYRVASYAQLLEELTLRSTTDVRMMRFTAVRKAVSWADVVKRLATFKDTQLHGSFSVGTDARGRGTVGTPQGVTVTPRLRVPAGAGASQPSNPR